MAEIDTRQRILDAAESLFTESGFDATTLRQITGAAEVNLAAVNYHFGSKEELIREVFRRRPTWLNNSVCRNSIASRPRPAGRRSSRAASSKCFSAPH